MIFFTTFVNYMFRVNMSISIIAMVEPMGGKEQIPECLLDQSKIQNYQRKSDTEPRYAWSQHIQGLILGSYFYGFIISSALAGPVSEYAGPWKATLITAVAQAFLNALTPTAATIHYGVVFAVRFIMGLTGGVAFPAMQILIAKWSPPAEKSKFISMLLGDTIGIVVTFSLVGQISATVDWKWGFYVLTVLMFVYCVAFFFIVSDSPDTHWFISQEEKEYIEASQQGVISKKKAKTPYRRILRSWSFWAMAVGEFGNLWGLYLLITGTPKFMVEVMGYNIKESGFLSALPYVGRCSGGLFFGWLGDVLKAKSTMETMTIRRIATIFSHFLPGLGLIAILAAGCNAIIVIALMLISLTVNGAVIIGVMQCPQDVAPNFAGTIYGWVMLFGATTGFIVPAITGALIEHHNGLAQWHIIFLTGGCVYIICGLYFMLTGSANLKSWNEIKEDEEEEEEKAI